MNNYNKLEKVKNDLNTYIDKLSQYEGNINPKEVINSLNTIKKTLES